MKRWQVHGHKINVLASQAGVKFAALAQRFVLLSVNELLQAALPICRGVTKWAVINKAR